VPCIVTLILRYLEKVFGANDPVRRRAAIDDLITEDCLFYEPGKAERELRRNHP